MAGWVLQAAIVIAALSGVACLVFGALLTRPRRGEYTSHEALREYRLGQSMLGWGVLLCIFAALTPLVRTLF